MSAIVRRPLLHVDIDGVLIPNVFSFRASHGYDLSVAECTVSVPVTPTGINYWSVLGIRAGATPGTAATRFNGFVVEVDYSLYPREVQLIARGPLIRAQQQQCNASGGVDLSAGGAGQTDQAMVTQLLAACGITGAPVPMSIGGTGKTLGTVASKYYTWAEGQSALAAIQQLDAICLGYRTFDTPSGGVNRIQISSVPSAGAALTFTEGVDIFTASPNVSVLQTKTIAQVTGYDDGSGSGPFNYTVSQSNSLMPFNVIDPIASNLIESSTTGGTGISAQEVAEWDLSQVNRALGKYLFTTPRDDVIAIGMTIAIVAPNRLGVSQNFWVQNVTSEIDQNGVWTQQIIALAGLTSIPGSGQGNTIGTPTGGVIDNGGTGGATTGGGGSQGGTPPTNTGPIVDFDVDVQTEEVIISGSYALLYDVQCNAHAQGSSAPIATYAWSCSGGTPTSSTDDTYVFTVSSITGSQTISLTVTDTAGNSTTISHVLTAPASGQVNSRPLYLAGTDCAEKYDGTIFHTHSGSGITVVANAAAFGDTGGDVISSPDNFATFNTTSPFGGAAVSALWVESSVNASRVLAGSSGGQIAVSNDGGGTWSIAAANPSGSNAILRCIISGGHPNQWFALCAGGLWRTDNAGSGWVSVVAAAGGESFTDVALSFGRDMITMTGGRKMVDFAGVAQTLPAGFGDPIAITAHIRKDRFYVMDSSGKTAYHATDGATTLTAGTALPGGTAQPRGLYRDGGVVDLIYIAAGSLVYKSSDGLRTSGGYHVLRQAGVSTAPSGATYTQIGADGNLVVPAVAPTTIYSSATAKAKTLWNGSGNNAPPYNWQDVSFDDSLWSAATVVTGGFFVPPTGSTKIWSSATPLGTTEETLFRHHFTLPTGAITAATLQIQADDNIGGVWINGTFLAGSIQADASGQPLLTLTVPPTILLAGANILAVHGRDFFLSGSDFAAVGYRLDVR